METDFTERQPRERSSSGMYFNSARMRQKILSGFQNNQDALKKTKLSQVFTRELYIFSGFIPTLLSVVPCIKCLSLCGTPYLETTQKNQV